MQSNVYAKRQHHIEHKARPVRFLPNLSSLSPFLTVGLALLSGHVLAATYYVSPTGNDANPGTLTQPWRSIGKANQTLQAGDTALLRAGTYSDQIRPARSGTSDVARIVYQAYGDGDVILTNAPGTMDPGEGAIALGARNYVSVNGAAPSDAAGTQRIKVLPNVFVNSYGNMCGGSFNVIENTYMGSTTPSKSGNRGFSFCTNFWAGNYETKYNVFRGNHVIGSAAQSLPYTEDLITLAKNAHHNLIDGNTLENCRHSTLYIDASTVHNNVIRNNKIINRIHSALSMWGAGGSNIVEGNHLEASGGAPSSYAGAGNSLQFQSPANIIRYNVITRGGATDNPYNSVGGIALASGGNQISAISAAENRVYNNTIVKNDGTALGVFWWPSAVDLGRSKFVNNILYGNNTQSTSNMKGTHVYYESTQSVPGGIRDLFIQNLIGNPTASSAAPSTSENVIFDPVSGGATAAKATATFRNPGSFEFRGILQVDPGFVDYTGGNYSLRSTSPLVNTGANLTTVGATDSGTGTTLKVDDARFFQDGKGIPGVQSDWIAIGSTATTARIVTVDYSTNVIMLSASISRRAGDKVWLFRRSDGRQVLFDSGADVGAFEFSSGSSSGGTTLAPPANLKVVQ
jgi:hypothetical protein